MPPARHYGFDCRSAGVRRVVRLRGHPEPEERQAGLESRGARFARDWHRIEAEESLPYGSSAQHGAARDD